MLAGSSRHPVLLCACTCVALEHPSSPTTQWQETEAQMSVGVHSALVSQNACRAICPGRRLRHQPKHKLVCHRSATCELPPVHNGNILQRSKGSIVLKVTWRILLFQPLPAAAAVPAVLLRCGAGTYFCCLTAPMCLQEGEHTQTNNTHSCNPYSAAHP
ncbi:hypothetical protein COO60DRAFT_413506 [Scenedesmus sp. NREL 46B-D3]|nr:hypothetical protein COO60DRAFT_413506 [Scenedesmus sp. NREL 46B-D3]